MIHFAEWLHVCECCVRPLSSSSCTGDALQPFIWKGFAWLSAQLPGTLTNDPGQLPNILCFLRKKKRKDCCTFLWRKLKKMYVLKEWLAKLFLYANQHDRATFRGQYNKQTRGWCMSVLGYVSDKQVLLPEDVMFREYLVNSSIWIDF